MIDDHAKLRYSFRVPDIELPRENVVMRWSPHAQAKETKRVRDWIWAHAIRDGFAHAVVLDKAHLKITIRGKYLAARDPRATWTKDLIDALVAREEFVRVQTGAVTSTGKPKMKTIKDGSLRWGLIEDDSRDCIGTPEIVEEVSEKIEIKIEVYDVE